MMPGRAPRKKEKPLWASFSYLSAVEIFLLSPDGSEVLLLRRGSHKKVLPGFYAGVGGKMDHPSLESPLAAAEREMLEESGYSPGELKERLRFKAVFTVSDRFGRWNVFEFSGRVGRKSFEKSRPIDEGTLEWVKLADLKKKKLIRDLRRGNLERILRTRSTLFVTVTYGKDDRIASLEVESDGKG